MELFTDDGTNVAEHLTNNGFAISSSRMSEEFLSKIPIAEEQKLRADGEEKQEEEDEAILRCALLGSISFGGKTWLIRLIVRHLLVHVILPGG